MSSELPPTEYFEGIKFNPDFYQSSSSDYLTATTGKKIFLSYPVAQDRYQKMPRPRPT